MLKQRVITALCLAPPLIAAIFYLPTSLFAILMAVIALLATHEWIRLSRPLVGHTVTWITLAIVAGIAVALIVSPLILHSDLLAMLVIGAGIVVWLFLLARLVKSTQWPAMSNEGLGFGVVSVVIALFTLIYVHQHAALGPVMVFCFMLAVAAADIGAYFSGKRFGRVKLAPVLSPGKTREGVTGGLITTAGICALVFVVGRFPSEQSLLMNALAGIGVGLATGVISIVGDLYVSFAKRHAGVKDTGHLLPGHGGVLDRIDSMLAAAPIFAALVITIAYLGG